MEELPETPKILDELSRSNLAKPASRQQSTARKRFIVILCIFSILIAGVMLLGYQQWMLQSRLAGMRDQNEQLSITLANQNTEIEALRSVHAEPVAAVPVDDTAMRELAAQLNAEITRLRQQLLTLQQQQQQSAVNTETGPDWKILEAEFLIGIASQRLQLQADLTSAIALLEDADAALLTAGDDSTFAARQAIADDLLLLREVTPVDLSGIYLRLDAMLGQVQSIDLLDSMRDRFQNRRDGELPAVAGDSAGNGIIDSSLNFLSSVFVWRKWDETPGANFALEQDTLNKQNLQLVLKQAQLALLLRDTTLYRHSLENAVEWLRNNSSPDSTITPNLLSSLNELLAIDIDPPLPNLERSLSAINLLTASKL